MTEFNLLILEEDTETQMGPTFTSTISVIIILKWNHHKSYTTNTHFKYMRKNVFKL